MDLLKSLSYASQNFLDNRLSLMKKSEKNSLENHRVIFWSERDLTQLHDFLKPQLKEWQLSQLESQAIQSFTLEKFTLWILQPLYFGVDSKNVGHNGKLEASLYGQARDLCGIWYRVHKPRGQVQFTFLTRSKEEIKGALVGLGLACYAFLDAVKGVKPKCYWKFALNKSPLPKPVVSSAYAIFSAMNISRHLSNMPGGIAYPEAIAEAIQKLFRKSKNLNVKIWRLERLKKEKMGLLVGVGQGSSFKPCLLHIRYNPLKSKKKKSVVFVGKGVTFDTGGLDIKPTSGMRLMKKDMAGAATVIGLAHAVSVLKADQPCDFFLPLAENSVSDRATRPGDIHMSRSGHLVEIDNTDAEGRLVLADAMDAAIDQVKDCAALIDVSTLTGAMRVALGLDVCGFFSNDDEIAKLIEQAACAAGELAWRMPLVQKYSSSLASTFADFKNSADSGFGGAITAALFLEKFAQKKPWVHFDVMSWNNSAQNAQGEGGNAQVLQTLAYFLTQKK